MPLILFWAEVEKEEEDKNYVFSGLIKREEKEESSLFLGDDEGGGEGGREGDFYLSQG
jgi:hypothetical protein